MEGRILTTILDPSVSIATAIRSAGPGRTPCCYAPVFDAGGGGIDVARTSKRQAGDPCTLVAAGGSSGTMLREFCEEAGLAMPGDGQQARRALRDGFSEAASDVAVVTLETAPTLASDRNGARGNAFYRRSPSACPAWRQPIGSVRNSGRSPAASSR